MFQYSILLKFYIIQHKEKQILIKENPEKDRFISKLDKKQVKEDNKILIQRFQTESNKMKEKVKQEESKITKYEKDKTYDKIDMNKKRIMKIIKMMIMI